MEKLRMPKKEYQPRSWDIDDLLAIGVRGGEKTHYLKAIPVLILEGWVQGERKENVANVIRTNNLNMRIVTSGLHSPFKPKATSNLLASLGSIQWSRNLTLPPLVEYQGGERVVSTYHTMSLCSRNIVKNTAN
jgi:lipopolysaccharide biosynthesis protein